MIQKDRDQLPSLPPFVQRLPIVLTPVKLELVYWLRGVVLESQNEAEFDSLLANCARMRAIIPEIERA